MQKLLALLLLHFSAAFVSDSLEFREKDDWFSQNPTMTPTTTNVMLAWKENLYSVPDGETVANSVLDGMLGVCCENWMAEMWS